MGSVVRSKQHRGKFNLSFCVDVAKISFAHRKIDIDIDLARRDGGFSLLEFCCEKFSFDEMDLFKNLVNVFD